MITNEFAENLLRWSSGMDMVPVPGSNSVWLKGNTITKLLTRRPGNQGWSVSNAFHASASAAVKRGMKLRIRLAFQVAVLMDGKHLFTQTVPHTETRLFNRTWYDCHPHRPTKPGETTAYWLLKGPSPHDCRNNARKLIKKMNAMAVEMTKGAEQFEIVDASDYEQEKPSATFNTIASILKVFGG